MILLAKGLTLFVEQPPLIETLVSVFGLCAIILTIINNVGPAIDNLKCVLAAKQIKNANSIMEP